ncbi:MAG: NUDIX domain-containing protein [Acidimicrobiales bacterium]
MRWTVHGERTIYDSPWVRLTLVDVEVPDGDRFEHHVVRFPRSAAGVVVHDPGRGVLLLWRHRFITDTWGWEVPAGWVEEAESVEAAAAARRWRRRAGGPARSRR